MPELPEVETIRRDLTPLLVGRRIARVRIHAGGERLAVTDVALARKAGESLVALSDEIGNPRNRARARRQQSDCWCQ